MPKASACALAAALGLFAIAAQAATGTTGESVEAVPTDTVQFADTDLTVMVVEVNPIVAVPPMQAGVRRAAAEGKPQLRRYIARTQAIYDYNYWDFAKYLPAE